MLRFSGGVWLALAGGGTGRVLGVVGGFKN